MSASKVSSILQITPSDAVMNETQTYEAELFQFDVDCSSNSMRSYLRSDSVLTNDDDFVHKSGNCRAEEDSASFKKTENERNISTNEWKNSSILEKEDTSIIHDNFKSDHIHVIPQVNMSQGMRFIHPTEYNIPVAQPPPLKDKSVKKISPMVYSAIGSLENVSSLASYGSFNYKLRLAAKAKEDKKDVVDVNSDHTVINRRISDGSPAGSLEAKKISALSNSLSTTNLSDPVPPPKKPNGIHHRASSEQTKSMDAVPITVPIIKNDSGITKRPKKISQKKSVTIDEKARVSRQVELFRPSCDAYTPRMGKKVIKHKSAEERQSIDKMANTIGMGTIHKPNFQDALRRVAMILQQHIVKIERRFELGNLNVNLFEPTMRDAFSEENFVTPRYKCTVVHLPMARPGIYYGMRKIQIEYKIPTADDIYDFGHRLFKQVQLSSECSIVGLIYVERLMETAKVPVMANTWRSIFMCGLLLASKVWQDWSSWNIEFASVYPQFSIESINRLELQFLKAVKWDLYISSSLYAKYYFALRALLEKQDFRQRYVRMVGGVDNVAASEAAKIAKRSVLLKEKSLEYLAISM